MANLTTADSFDSIYRIDAADPVQGWDGATNGIDNDPHQALGNRTHWLKNRVDQGMRFTAHNLVNVVTPGDTFAVVAGDFKGKHYRIDTAAGVGELLLPVLASLADNDNIVITVDPGTSFNFTTSTFKNITLTPNAADTITDLDNDQINVASVKVMPGTTFRLWKYNGNNWCIYRMAAPERGPVGAQMIFPMANPPHGWLKADGSLVLRATYPALFALIGVTFGSTLGTNFQLPDLTAWAPVGHIPIIKY